MAQMVLPLGWDNRVSGGFLVSTCNHDAVRHLEHPGTWPVKTSILQGPARSGRSTLGAAFHAATDGMVMDDAEHAPDVQIFHAWNHAAQSGNPPLLLIAQKPVSQWSITLPDLRSRLNAAPVVTIQQPDDDLMCALINRLFQSRGTLVEPGLAEYLVTRVERSYAMVDAVVDAIDAYALARKRRITRAVAKEAHFASGLIALQDGSLEQERGR